MSVIDSKPCGHGDEGASGGGTSISVTTAGSLSARVLHGMLAVGEMQLMVIVKQTLRAWW